MACGRGVIHKCIEVSIVYGEDRKRTVSLVSLQLTLCFRDLSLSVHCYYDGNRSTPLVSQ